MAENTKIEWADHTFNPCDNCYAENLMDHRMSKVKWGAGRLLDGRTWDEFQT